MSTTSRLSADIEIVRNSYRASFPEAEYYEAMERLLARASQIAETEEVMLSTSARIRLKKYENDPNDDRLDDLVDIVRRAITEIDPEHMDQVAGVSTDQLQTNIDGIAELRQLVHDFHDHYSETLYRNQVDQIVAVVRKLSH